MGKLGHADSAERGGDAVSVFTCGGVEQAIIASAIAVFAPPLSIFAPALSIFSSAPAIFLMAIAISALKSA